MPREREYDDGVPIRRNTRVSNRPGMWPTTFAIISLVAVVAGAVAGVGGLAVFGKTMSGATDSERESFQKNGPKALTPEAQGTVIQSLGVSVAGWILVLAGAANSLAIALLRRVSIAWVGVGVGVVAFMAGLFLLLIPI